MDLAATADVSSAEKPKRAWLPFLVMWLLPGCLVAWLHFQAIGLGDTPGSDPITLTQAATAALGNTLGPWAGHVVRFVDFPNAGLRSFNAVAAIALTLLYAGLAVTGMRTDRGALRRACFAAFFVATLAWYGYGFYLISDGML